MTVKLKLSLSAPGLYNNPEDSDLKIILSSGVIHAHKIILKRASDMCRAKFNGKMSDSGDVEVRFDYSDDAVVMLVKYMYGMVIDPSKLDFDVWMELFALADELQVVSLIDALDHNIPEDVPVDVLLEFASARGRTEIIKHIAVQYDHLHGVQHPDMLESFKASLSQLSISAYDDFRKVCLEQVYHFHILIADSVHCDSNYTGVDREKRMIELALTLHFHKFNQDDLMSSMELPIIADIPILYHLLLCTTRAAALAHCGIVSERLSKWSRGGLAVSGIPQTAPLGQSDIENLLADI